jgi:hypothetical protein
MRLIPAVLAAVLAALAFTATPAGAAPSIRFGIQDDAWLASGAGTLESRLDLLERLGVSLVRFRLRWDQIAPRRPVDARSPSDPAYDWEPAASVLAGLRARGIRAVVGIWGTPKWANGGLSPACAPTTKWSLANFAYAAQKRFPWVRHWLIWNEPNRTRWLRPTSARLYTQLLNVAYNSIHRANRRAVVAGGVTAPRGGQNGVSPVDWIRAMARYRARLDAYAHNPYPGRPSETPWTGGCTWHRCTTVTMATLERLLAEVERAFGRRTRIWLTEYGYQTNPPDRLSDVSPARQARYVASAARRVHAAPRVDMLIHFMVRDDTHPPGWQSGFISSGGVAKPSFRAYMLPFAQESRRGMRTVLWGQVRPRTGRQQYRLQQFRRGRWQPVGGTYRTSPRGFLKRVVRAGPGTKLRLWSPRDRTASPILTVR